MDWIERYFNVNPDHGDGTFEALIIILAALVVLASIPMVRRRFRALVTRIAEVDDGPEQGRSA